LENFSVICSRSRFSIVMPRVGPIFSTWARLFSGTYHRVLSWKLRSSSRSGVHRRVLLDVELPVRLADHPDLGQVQVAA
jgi:hypothetical protein